MDKNPEQKLDLGEAYNIFIELLFKQFLRTSGIWWGPFIHTKGARKGQSFHQEIEENIEKAIENLTAGKQHLLLDQMLDKLEAALLGWAVETMGEGHFRRAVEYSLNNFWSLVMLRMGLKEREDFLAVIDKTPLCIPTRISNEPGFPQYNISPTQLKKEYETLLAHIKKIKRKTKGDPASQKMALMEMSGITSKQAALYQGMKASKIAHEYLARKYNLGLSGEGLKKHLLKRIPQDIMDLEILRIKRDLFKKGLRSIS